jgi:hypothetical protein
LARNSLEASGFFGVFLGGPQFDVDPLALDLPFNSESRRAISSACC